MNTLQAAHDIPNRGYFANVPTLKQRKRAAERTEGSGVRAVTHPTHFLMPADLPVEIWLKICRLACVDDGKTGRALSAVSRYVRAATREYHYRTVAIHGLRQANRFLGALKAVPHPTVPIQVRHLYIADARNHMMQGMSNPARRAEEAMVLRELLVLASPTVETVSIVSLTSNRTSSPDHIVLDDLHLPKLTELTLRGCYSIPLQASFAPRLSRLHISSDVLFSPFARLIPKFYPKLTHIRISRLEYVRHLEDTLQTLCITMGLPLRRDNQRGEDDPNTRSPTPPAAVRATRFIFVEPGPGHWIGIGGEPVLAVSSEREMLWRLLQQLDTLVILPQHPGYGRDNEVIRAKAQWLDRLNGGVGCWLPSGGDEDDRGSK